ncbi:MAG: hypothetical protein IPH97_05205 [Ignavibacteriales bacterium]|nr:hypothetical protein [Ignavibacteriales bacterium]
MLLKFHLVVLVVIAVSVNTYSQVFESIEKAAAQYFINLSNKNLDADNDLIKLKDLLFQSYDKVEFESKYQTSINQFDSLKNHFNKYETAIRNISKDSALVLFNQFYLHFSNLFYNYADEKFFSSNKIKLLFFSTSMSCHCTLEMCKKQTIEILNLAKEKNLVYWIIDSYEHNELQIKYETLFAPSLILFDGNNNVLHKIEYDENLLPKLSEFIKTKLKGE